MDTSGTRSTMPLGAGAMRCGCFLQLPLARFFLWAGIWLPRCRGLTPVSN